MEVLNTHFRANNFSKSLSINRLILEMKSLSFKVETSICKVLLTRGTLNRFLMNTYIIHIFILPQECDKEKILTHPGYFHTICDIQCLVLHTAVQEAQ